MGAIPNPIFYLILLGGAFQVGGRALGFLGARFGSVGGFFGSKVVGAAFVPSYGVISCLAPAGVVGSSVGVEVSLNAQQYSVGGFQFAYHDVVGVSGYSPSSGPSAGERGVAAGMKGPLKASCS